MLRYFPLDIGFEIDAVGADLLSFNWAEAAAEFAVGENGSVLRIRFQTEVIVRMVDEMPLSTETDQSACQGLVPHHFAYRVEGASFAEQQSETWLFVQRQVHGHVRHFRFVTGGGCLDVVTASEPEFTLIP